MCDEWRTEFNHVRPHEALDMKTPADLYRPSPRRPSRVVVGGYPDCCTLLKVGNRGSLQWRSHLAVYVTLALCGLHVGVEERADGFVYVWFFDRLLGRFVPGKDQSVPPIIRDAAAAEVAKQLMP